MDRYLTKKNIIHRSVDHRWDKFIIPEGSYSHGSLITRIIVNY